MSEFEYESEISSSEHEAVYTHFKSINNEDTSVELTCTIEDSTATQDSIKVSTGSKFKSCVLKCCENFVLLVLIFIIWSALSIPSVFFIISMENGLNDTGSPPFTNTCTPTPYTGTVCGDYLRSYQRCLPNSGSDVYVPESVDQDSNENILRTLDGIRLETIGATPECVSALKPFACLYYFGMCNEVTNKTLRPSFKQCRKLKSTTCEGLVSNVKRLDLGHLLPKCHGLPDSGPSATCANNTPLVPVRATNLTCNTEFGFIFNSTISKCVASCEGWTPYSNVELRITNVVVIISGAVAILSGAILLILACVRCKKIFSFPSVFIVYQTIPTIILGGLVLIAFVGQPYLFCTPQSSAIDSMNHPTPFCTATGVCLYYIMMQLILLWFFHVITMFWGVYWPIQANIVQASSKRIVLHIIAVCLALVMPAIPVCIIHFMSSPGFTVTRFPPILCAAGNLNLNFYTFMLPISVIIACGLTLLVLIFWKLLKKKIIHCVHKTRIDTNWCSHSRILIVFCYFVIFGLIVLSTFTVAMINFRFFVVEVEQYFQCEAGGVSGLLATTNGTSTVTNCEEKRKAIENLINPVTTTIALIVLGFYPAINLVYVMHCRELKDSCSCCQPTREVEYTYRRESPYSTVNMSSSVVSSVRGVRLDTHGLL